MTFAPLASDSYCSVAVRGINLVAAVGAAASSGFRTKESNIGGPGFFGGSMSMMFPPTVFALIPQ